MTKFKYVEGFDDKIGLYIDEYVENSKISIITDYETAKEIYDNFGEDYYEDYASVNLQSDVDGYLIDITLGELFVIEPITRNGRYFTIEADKLIIEEQFLNSELERFLDCEDIVIVKEECDEEYEEEYLEDDDEEFTIDDLCSYVLVDKLYNCKTMKEEIEALKELYEIGFNDGYNKAIQDDVEEKLDYLNGDFEE